MHFVWVWHLVGLDHEAVCRDLRCVGQKAVYEPCPFAMVTAVAAPSRAWQSGHSSYGVSLPRVRRQAREVNFFGIWLNGHLSRWTRREMLILVHCLIGDSPTQQESPEDV